MVDKWETDTFNDLNIMRKDNNAKPLVWQDAQHQIANEYATKMIIPWERIDEEKWMPFRVPMGQINSNGKGVLAKWHFEDNNYNYIGQGADGAQGTGWVSYFRQRKTPLYSTNNLWANPIKPKGVLWGNIVVSCICPHWTPPKKIVDMLWSNELKDYYGNYGAIAIVNDDSRTYVALAVSEWLISNDKHD